MQCLFAAKRQFGSSERRGKLGVCGVTADARGVVCAWRVRAGDGDGGVGAPQGSRLRPRLAPPPPRTPHPLQHPIHAVEVTLKVDARAVRWQRGGDRDDAGALLGASPALGIYADDGLTHKAIGQHLTYKLTRSMDQH
eukprot:3817124-Rhodomonas_salina.1